MSSRLMLVDIIMNIFSDITKHTTYSVRKNLFSKIQDDRIYLCKDSLQDYSRKKQFMIPKRHYVHIISLKKQKLRKYLSGVLSIVIDESYIEKKTNQLTNYISNFNHKHILQCYNEAISNIPEDPRYISSMTSNGFINSQDKSGCYVNFSFQVLF